MDKRGASMVIAWVLLVGLSISLAIFVGTWLQKQTRDISESIVEDSTVQARCADVNFIGVPNCDNTGSVPFFVDADVTNTGSFTIKKVKCFGNDVDFSSPSGGDTLLQPEETIKKTLNNCNDESNPRIVIAIPFIEIKGKDFGCAEKSLRLAC